MNQTIRFSIFIALFAFLGTGTAQAQKSPDTAMLHELLEQIEILGERINRSPEREHLRKLEEHIEMPERKLRERSGPPNQFFSEQGRLEQSVTLEFSGGGANASVTTAMARLRICWNVSSIHKRTRIWSATSRRTTDGLDEENLLIPSARSGLVSRCVYRPSRDPRAASRGR